VDTLRALGWNDRLSEEFEQHRPAGLVPARVAVQHRGAWDVLGEAGELRVDLAGRLRHEALSAAELPVVGDWVAVASRPGESGGTIQAVLPRTTRFSRKTAWQATEEQVLVANVDVVFVVTSLNEDLNPRRLERYLILAWESGATPVLVLTKSDLVDDVAPAVAAVETVSGGVPVLATSTVTGAGLEAVRARLPTGVTGAVLGSSGVGKSTLVNALVGEDVLATQAIREDGRGRHTTTRRELILLPGGGLVVDTPGLRELQLWAADDGLDEVFEDVTALFAGCRFSDCAHDAEPDCAVRAALDDGTLPAERWESYLKLQAELAHLERRLDKRAQSEARKRWRALSREAAERLRLKGRGG
jgi:ribosome biogenesis GTPase / thiamine phosphate phosphatase